MKNIVRVLILSFVFIACDKNEKQMDGYKIDGTAKGIYNGVRVYLNEADDKGRQTPVDTAIVMNEKFEFNGKVATPKMQFLSINSVNGSLPLIVENAQITIEINKEKILDSKITGTKANQALTDYANGFDVLMEQRNELNEEARPLRNTNDTVAKNVLQVKFDKVTDQLKNYPYEYLKEHKDNYFSLTLIKNLLDGRDSDFTKIEALYNDIDNDLKNSDYGKEIGSAINVKKQEMERLSMLNVGSVAPDFTAPDTNGNSLSLKDIKGKVTIIDFWASWCKPCRIENPNVVKVYNKYHDKGLEIVSVSLDKPGQKERWVKAIEEDKLAWHHVSNLNYFNDPVARLYDINSIPATYILDAEGKIVAKSLRGKALEDKIAELLN